MNFLFSNGNVLAGFSEPHNALSGAPNGEPLLEALDRRTVIIQHNYWRLDDSHGISGTDGCSLCASKNIDIDGTSKLFGNDSLFQSPDLEFHAAHPVDSTASNDAGRWLPILDRMNLVNASGLVAPRKMHADDASPLVIVRTVSFSR
ncbi:hypothetical protein L1887_62257 [Cichorium endivia]|nr:hypothetical protein L1887_62257 [Cichorium endivia]